MGFASFCIYLQSFHHFKFKFSGLDREMAATWPWNRSPELSKVRSAPCFEPDLLEGSRGQLWPGNDRKTKLKVYCLFLGLIATTFMLGDLSAASKKHIGEGARRLPSQFGYT